MQLARRHAPAALRALARAARAAAALALTAAPAAAEAPVAPPNRPMAAAQAPRAPRTPPPPRGVTAEARTNVYLDNDGNRVVTPTVVVAAEVNERVSLTAHAALDIMTCASVDVITAATPRGAFEEGRREAGGAIALRDGLARWSLSGQGSLEHDYGSATVAVGWSDEFAQRNTTVALGYSFTDSDVRRAHDVGFERDLDSHTFSATLTQVLSPRWIAQLTAWTGVFSGFQSSVYRYVRFRNGAAGPEVMPALRLRQAGVVQLRGALSPALFLGADYRLYGDSWGIAAHSGEATVSWLPRPSLTLRLRDRLHQQTASPYYRSRFEGPMRYMSADRELGAMWSNLAGAKASWRLPSGGGRLQQLSLDAKVDLVWQQFEDFPWLPQRRWTAFEVGVQAGF
jgi:hypothetical protein